MSVIDFDKLREDVRDIDPLRYLGRVYQIVGLAVESNGPAVRIGEMCEVYTLDGSRFIKAEVVGFKEKNVMLMPYGELGGIGPGSRVVSTNKSLIIPVGDECRGRILDGLGNPMDGKGPIRNTVNFRVENSPPNPLERRRIKEILPMGIRALDGLLTCGRGQRLGIFAGSGVGKSTLMGMIARNAKSDINVITLIGERGREVNDFIEKDLQEEGLKRSIIVVATSDQPALIRLKSAMVGTAIAEYFRDQGLNVVLMMDSITRFAMSQREIGMAIGEPPVSRGYTPSVFTLLPKLLERSGNSKEGSITALYTVLVEGDDLNEPITDTVRGILDGHIVLSRDLANRNHYPAIDVLASVSRLMPDIVDQEHYEGASEMKNLMAVYRDAQDLINIGAYKTGSNPEIDQAIKHIGNINDILRQKVGEPCPYEQTVERVRAFADMR